MPTLLNFVPNAISQRQAQIVYAEVAKPAPASFTDPLYVFLPDWSNEIPITITDWPAVHGLTLPLVGDAALLITDSRGLRRCVWWDGEMAFSTQTSLAYYLTPTASDVSTYYELLPAPFATKTPIPFTGINNLQVLRNYVTQPRIPALTFLPAGQYEFHIHAAQTAGNQSVQLYAEFWECGSTGTDIAMIGQTQVSLPLTLDEIEYRLFFTTVNTYALATNNSRIVCRLKALVGGTGGASVQLFVGGESDSHTVLPTVTRVPLGASDWTAVSVFSNSWGNIGSGFETAAYLKDPSGFVHVKGAITGGTSGTTAFVLPAGYRPGAKTFHAAPAGDLAGACVEIDISGNLMPSYSGVATSVGLSGINFLAEN